MDTFPESKLAAIDCETTGIDPDGDRIVKLAAVLVDLSADVAQAKTFEATVNPGIPIPPDATRIHGITDADVADAGSFGEIAQQLKDFVGDRPLLGFNVQFDKQFLNAELKRHGFTTFYRKRSYCVQGALEDIWHYRPALANAAERMRLTGYDGAAHDPLQDALATIQLAGMLKRLPRHEVWKAPGDRWTANPAASDPPTAGQLAYIRSLGGSTSRIKTKLEASRKIERLKGAPPDDEDPDGCITVLPMVVWLVFTGWYRARWARGGRGQTRGRGRVTVVLRRRCEADE